MINIPWNVSPYAFPLAQHGLWKPLPKNTRKKSRKLTWARVVDAQIKYKSDTNTRRNQS